MGHIATTFTTATNVNIGGKSLPSEVIPWWTIPGRRLGACIFNSEIEEWGAYHFKWGKSNTLEIQRKQIAGSINCPRVQNNCPQTIERFSP